MAGIGKKFKAAVEQVDIENLYDLSEAIELSKKVAFAKFDETVEIAIRLGVDPRHADQMVRGAVTLPHGTGKKISILVFAKGEKAKEAEEAGADFVGDDELAKKIQGGWFGFDKVVATPDMMATVGKLGRVLGPRGLMPNPKVGTVTQNVGKVVAELKSGMIEYRVDKTGIIHSLIGKKSFDAKKLEENCITLMDSLIKAKPSSAKGQYIRSVVISTTMGPGVKVDYNKLVNEL